MGASEASEAGTRARSTPASFPYSRTVWTVTMAVPSERHAQDPTDSPFGLKPRVLKPEVHACTSFCPRAGQTLTPQSQSRGSLSGTSPRNCCTGENLNFPEGWGRRPFPPQSRLCHSSTSSSKQDTETRASGFFQITACGPQKVLREQTRTQLSPRNNWHPLSCSEL